VHLGIQKEMMEWLYLQYPSFNPAGWKTSSVYNLSFTTWMLVVLNLIKWCAHKETYQFYQLWVNETGVLTSWHPFVFIFGPSKQEIPKCTY
jgi:hypothetical protein